jgi:ribosomal protein L7/L12
MSDITKDQVIDWLSSQSVIEIADLVKELEDKWGVSAAAPAAVAVAALSWTLCGKGFLKIKGKGLM